MDSAEDPEETAAQPQVIAASDEESFAWEVLEEGSDCSLTAMPYAKWCRVYVTTKAPPEGRGVVLLLVERVFPHKLTDGMWTAVDAKRRISVVNVRDKAKITPRPRLGVKYTDVGGFRQSELIQIEQSSAATVAKRNGLEVAGAGKKNRKKRKPEAA